MVLEATSCIAAAWPVIQDEGFGVKIQRIVGRESSSARDVLFEVPGAAS